MHILLTVDGVPPIVIGGIQNYGLSMAKAFSALGARVSLVYALPYGSDQVLVEDPFAGHESSGSRAYPVVRPKPGRLPGHYLQDSFRLSEGMLQLSRKVAPDADLIYAHGQTGRAFIEAKRKGASLPPVCVHAHGYEMFQSPPSFRVRLEHYLLRPTFARMSEEADYVFSYGGKIQEILRGLGLPDERILPAANGIDAEWLRNTLPQVAGGKRRFLFVGRDERRKGIEELHAAIKEIPEGKAEFHFVGPIPEERQMTRPDLYYHGLVRDPGQLRKIYDAADVLLCPSHSEGLPTVALLAMARGLAVIATDVGAVAAIVSDQNGILLPSPSVPALKTAIDTAIGWSPQALQTRQQYSLERSRNFTWEAVAEDTIRSFEDILQK